MKKLELTIWQRFACLQVLGTIRGNLQVMRLGAKLMDKVELSEEEMEQAGVRSMNGVISWQGACSKEVSLTEPEFQLLKRSIRDYDDWSVLVHDELFDLSDKLEIEYDEAA